jgi:putative transposase
VCDITHVWLGTEGISLAMMMAVFTHDVRGWRLSRTLGQELMLIALQWALAPRTPLIHHGDQGMQYAAPHMSRPCWPLESDSAWPP